MRKNALFLLNHHIISDTKCKGRLSKKRWKKYGEDGEKEKQPDSKNQIKEENFGKMRKKSRNMTDLHKKGLYKKILYVMI